MSLCARAQRQTRSGGSRRSRPPASRVAGSKRSVVRRSLAGFDRHSRGSPLRRGPHRPLLLAPYHTTMCAKLNVIWCAEQGSNLYADRAAGSRPAASADFRHRRTGSRSVRSGSQRLELLKSGSQTWNLRSACLDDTRWEKHKQKARGTSRATRAFGESGCNDSLRSQTSANARVVRTTGQDRSRDARDRHCRPMTPAAEATGSGCSSLSRTRTLPPLWLGLAGAGCE